ncbi:fat-like cadherin-related tumor suppressor isoform X5, partial [Dinothrombium tinctorium]
LSSVFALVVDASIANDALTNTADNNNNSPFENKGEDFEDEETAAFNNEVSTASANPGAAEIRFEESFKFTKTFYNVSIPENSQGKTYATVVVPHASVGSPRKQRPTSGAQHFSPYAKMGIYVSDAALTVRYKIISGDDKKIFKAEARRVGDFVFLMIRTRTSETVLNREQLDNYRLVVRATITSNRNEHFRIKTKCEVHVQVEDVNDLIPYFYITDYDVNVPEDIAVDSNLVRVSAFDADAGINGEVYYSLEESSDASVVSKMFAVHPTMGIVTNTRLFTSDTSSEQTGTGKREYRLTILATDRRTNLYKSHKSLYSGMYYVAMSKANLKITVESVNKHPPKLRIEQHSSSSPSPPSLITSQTSKSTSTSSPLDSPLVYAIVRVDDDDGEHSIFGRICSLTIEDGNDLNMFVISNSSTSSKEYYIELKRPYSLSPSMYNATLKASRSGYPRLNPNGFGLEFNLTLKAVDCGGLFTTKSVNVVLNPFSAKSSWNPFSSSSFPIWSIISLLKPTFKKEYYFAEIHEIALIGSEVLHLEVDIPFHSDSNVYIETKLGSLPLVSYSIMNGNYQQVFGITSNGVIFTRKELDFEKQNEYTIVIAAHLRSPVTGAAIMSSSSFSTTQVHIKVIDDNDNDPIFSNQSSKLSFSSPHFASLIFDENKPNGSLLCSVLATDADSGENGFISYAFTNSERIPFAINQETGEIRTTEVIDYEAGAREYFLIVRASDWGIPFRRHSELVINVTIRDTNDHRPQFERKDCTAYIPFKTKPYSEIITLSAIDFDARSLVTYKMASNPPGDDLSNCFELDEITGVLRLKCYLKEYLNSDSPKETYVNVSATDGQHFADVMPIKIVIVETKDALPVTQRKSHRRRATTESILVECKSENVGIIEKIKRHMLRDSNSVVESSSSTSDGKANAQIKSLTVPQINANKPIIHPNIPKVIYIRENIPRGHSFMTLSADDADEGYNGLLIWSLNVNEYEETNMFKTMPFDVDMFSGKLKAIDSIDRETQSKYKLNVTVCDLGSNPGQLCSSRDLEIIVDDDNDNQPKFESSIYYFSVPEDTKSGSTVGRLQAEDIDLSHNSVLTYSLLNHRKYFAVDLATGSLSTREKLDREEVAKYKLHVTVNDNGVPSMSSTATVIIDIIDVNDNAPQFREPHYFARVREDLPIGTVVTKINAFDYDAGSNAKIKYSFRRDGNEDSHFSIDHLMGTIRISKELDFEEKQLYNLTIIAEDHGDPVLSSKVSLLIEVEDVDENEYAPRFSDFVASGSVAENSPLGTYVMTVNALDDDIYSGLPGDRSVVYQLVEGDGLGMFDIDSKGNIYTAAVLDRETNWRYWLTVVAKDKAAVPKSSHTHLFIEVKDENDNAPITVEPFYFVKIEENASIATTIIQLQAYDPDVNGESSEINYRILNDGKDCVFKIDSKTGIIQTKARLDHELQTQYVLDIEISENAIGENGHYLTSKTPVIINVLDVNDNKPQFVHTIFLCQTYNNLKDTIPICQVVAYDADDVGSNQMVANDNGKLSFSIIDDNEFFRIDESSGAIYFKGSGNISKGKYYLIVKAFDNGSPRHSSQAKVLIEVLDSEKEIENENHAPELDSESVDTNIELSENEKIGTLITFIKALDADDDKICSHIVDGNSAGVFASFEGALFVAKRIDYESSQKFVLTIMLTDVTNKQYLSQITIAIVDINDNIPRFLQDLYTINIFENITKETVIFTLEVDDVDIYDNNVFSLYSSGSPQSLNKFTIEQWTGKLRVKESLDHEVCKQHVLIVEAADSSVTTDGISSAKMMKTSPDQSRPTLPPFVSSSHRSFTKIVINVLDVNDHSPKFISTSNEVKIPENSAVGTSVISLLAIDADTGINAEITYSITSGNVNDVFGIDEQLGYIFIQKPLNVKLQPEYYLAVKAIDGGDIPLSSSTNVHIIVTVPDNLPPEFPKREYIIDLKEDAKVGYIITSAVKAISRQSLFYELTEDGEDSPNFGINLNTGEIYLKKSIDYETNPLHKLKVSATNLMGANDSTLVLINVLDVNDNPDHTVIFTQKMYEGSLFENATRGKEVLRVHAASTDIGVNVDVTYQIVSGNEEYTFALDRKNGTLSLWNSVDFESVKEHLLVVKAEDSRIPFLSAETHVKVTVIDVNDNAPQFIQKSYSAVIREDAAVNEKILQVMATDADSFENAELSYFFVDTSDGNNVKRSQYKEFKIDSENGIIYIDAKLDREMVC